MNRKFIATAVATSALLITAGVSATVTAFATAIELPMIPLDSLNSEDSSESAHTHVYTLTSTVSPDCKNNGEAVYTCECGDSYTETLPATGNHTYGTWRVVNSPSCTSDGTVKRTCTVCGEVTAARIGKIGHSYTATVTAPTYFTVGSTSHVCIRCSDSYTDNYKSKKQLAKPSITYSNTSSSAVRIKWSKVAAADGYRVEIYSADSKKWTAVGTVGKSTLEFRKSGLKSAATYKFRVKAYVKQNALTAWSGYSSLCTAVTLPEKSAVDIKAVSSSAVRIGLKSVACTGYEVYLYKNGKWACVKNLSPTATVYRITGLKKNTSYKVKVRAYVKSSSGEKLYGTFSTVKTFKTK
jgi:hypothetical protein